jgi:PPOX class probable F420-dependent enzyme
VDGRATAGPTAGAEHLVAGPSGRGTVPADAGGLTATEARRRFAAARVARLATADRTGRPHVVPIVFALDGDTVYSAVDHKPKRTTALRRLANIAENPAVALLVDHYDDADWSRLWWVRADGAARVVPPGSTEAAHAVALLQHRYGPYVDRPPTGPYLAVDVSRWSGWTGDGGAGGGPGLAATHPM